MSALTDGTGEWGAVKSMGEDEAMGNEEIEEVENERMRLELREQNWINLSCCDLQAKALKEELTQPLQLPSVIPLLPGHGDHCGSTGQQESGWKRKG